MEGFRLHISQSDQIFSCLRSIENELRDLNQKMQAVELALTRQGFYGTRCHSTDGKIDGHIVELFFSEDAEGAYAIVWSDNKIHRTAISNLVFDM